MTTQTTNSAIDRRKHRRFRVDRPGKLRHHATQQYSSVRTRDLSFGGALLEVESARQFKVGEIVDVGVALTGEAVVDSGSLVQGVVVRVCDLADSRRAIAVRYMNAGALKRMA